MSEAPELDRALLLDCKRIAVEHLTSEGSVRPFAYVVTEDAAHFVPAVEEFNDDYKSKFSKIIKLAALAAAAQRVAFVSEAWGVFSSGEDEVRQYDEWRQNNPGASLESCPIRKEVMLITVESYLGKLDAAYMIERDARGKPSLGSNARPDVTGEYEFVPVNTADRETVGRFANFLPPPALAAHPEARATAGKLLQLMGAAWLPIDDDFNKALARGEKPWERVLQ